VYPPAANSLSQHPIRHLIYNYIVYIILHFIFCNIRKASQSAPHLALDVSLLYYIFFFWNMYKFSQSAPHWAPDVSLHYTYYITLYYVEIYVIIVLQFVFRNIYKFSQSAPHLHYVVLCRNIYYYCITVCFSEYIQILSVSTPSDTL